MKHVFASLTLLFILSAISANPIEPMAIGKIWFNDQAQAQMEFAPNMDWCANEIVNISDGFDSYTYTVDFTAPEPIIITLPSGHLTPQQGYIYVGIPGSISESAHWGSDISNDFSSLNGTECAVRTLMGNAGISYSWFAKDYTPTSGEFMNPSARSTIDIMCVDFSGAPAANVPIYAWGFYEQLGVTDSNGHAILSVFSSKSNIRIKNPLTNTEVFNTTFFAEPGQTYNFTVNLGSSAGDDQIIPVPAGNFSIYPSVLRFRDNGIVNLSYDAKLDADSHIELYDIKGRLLDSRVYTSTNMQMQLPKLSSGVYFLRLSNKGRLLGNSKLIVLK